MDVDSDLAHKNNLAGLALLGLALLIFAGTVVVGLLYLHFD